ncbi:MAG: hypothetical protein K2X61_06485 [Caulobacteraceae bacterium]|nr:hypothetical protein [Caulobacteraceae bacterium]
MALTFPRPMPTGGVESQAFQIARADFQSPTLNGGGGGVTAGFPRWRMAATLANTTADETEDWIAFLDSLRGSQRLFLGRDLTRPYPKAYPAGFSGMTRAGGGSFDGSATGWSINTAGDVASLSGLPAGLALGLKDYVGFRWTTGGSARRALVRVVEPATANGSGVISGLTVEPAVPTLVPDGAVAFLNEPDCLMRIVTEETSMGEIDTLHSGGGSVVALQELLA